MRLQGACTYGLLQVVRKQHDLLLLNALLKIQFAWLLVSHGNSVATVAAAAASAVSSFSSSSAPSASVLVPHAGRR